MVYQTRIHTCPECGKQLKSMGVARHRAMHSDNRLKEISKIEFIVICGQIVGNTESGFSEVYNWDHERFSTLKDAKSHGFNIRESDDFNIATIRGNKLLGVSWMEKPFKEGEFDRRAIEEQLGFTHS